MERVEKSRDSRALNAMQHGAKIWHIATGGSYDCGTHEIGGILWRCGGEKRRVEFARMHATRTKFGLDALLKFALHALVQIAHCAYGRNERFALDADRSVRV